MYQWGINGLVYVSSEGINGLVLVSREGINGLVYVSSEGINGLVLVSRGINLNCICKNKTATHCTLVSTCRD